MLGWLYRLAVRLHPSSFRQRFGEEMLYIFDQQKGMRAALGVMQDCVLSLLRQWTLRPQKATDVPAARRGISTAEYIPAFETLDTSQPSTSAIIHGILLSLILFYMTVFGIRYSWIHVLHIRIPEIAGNPSQTSSERQQVNVIPTESKTPQTKAIAPTRAQAPVAPVRTRGETIWLDPYVGKYISSRPPTKISIQVESDPLRGNHVSLSLAAGGYPSLPLLPVSPARFVLVGTQNSYVDFKTDVHGRICCLSFVANGNAITAQRQ